MTDQLNERLREKITKIVFENGGTVEPLVDKLLNLVKQEVTKARIKEFQDTLDVIYDSKNMVFKTTAGSLKDYLDGRIANLRRKK